jgi:hypothetical protein
LSLLNAKTLTQTGLAAAYTAFAIHLVRARFHFYTVALKRRASMSNTNVAQTKVNSSKDNSDFINQDSDTKQLDFYTVRSEIINYILQNGVSKTESKLLAYLIKLDPFGDRPVKIKVAEVCLEIGIGRTAYRAARKLFESLGWFEFTDTEIIVRNLTCKQSKAPSRQSKAPSRQSEIPSRQSEIPSNQNLKVSQSKDSEASQISSDLFRSDPDQIDDDFLNFEQDLQDIKNSDFENIDSSEQNQIDKFEDHQELIQKDELTEENKVVETEKEIDEINTPAKAKETIEGDSFRRAVDDFILKNSENVRNPVAYLKSIPIEHRRDWEKRYKDSIAPSAQNVSTKNSYQQSHKPRDPVAEDPHKLAMAIDSAMRCRDIDAAIARLEVLRGIDAAKARDLAIKHGLQSELEQLESDRTGAIADS